MALKEELEKSGNWLFRWRSYLPLLLFGIILIVMRHSEYPSYLHMGERLWGIICLTISFFGLSIRMYTVGYAPKGTSGRNTHKQRAEVLNITGIYSLLRHPLYLGNFFCGLGISMFVCVWWISLIFILVFWLYYERIMFAEEEFLRIRFGNQFESWANQTPAILPRFMNWKPNILSFSFRNVLRREYSGLFTIIMSFTFLQVVGDILREKELDFDLMWFVIFCVGLVSCLILRILKKKTDILTVAGR